MCLNVNVCHFVFVLKPIGVCSIVMHLRKILFILCLHEYFNPGPSCCEATVLSTAPTCHYTSHYTIFNFKIKYQHMGIKCNTQLLLLVIKYQHMEIIACTKRWVTLWTHQCDFGSISFACVSSASEWLFSRKSLKHVFNTVKRSIFLNVPK